MAGLPGGPAYLAAGYTTLRGGASRVCVFLFLFFNLPTPVTQLLLQLQQIWFICGVRREYKSSWDWLLNRFKKKPPIREAQQAGATFDPEKVDRNH